MSMRSLVFVSVIAIGVAGCFHRSTYAIGDEVSPPHGLDSAGTAKWIAQQRATCPGELHFMIDHMPTVSLDGSPAPYQSGIIAVVCARAQASRFSTIRPTDAEAAKGSLLIVRAPRAPLI
jgi:hypothetical protein